MIKIGIVDDHRVVIDGLKQLIQLNEHIIVVGEYTCYEDALLGLKQQHIDMLIVDILLQGLSGLDLIKEVKTTYPNIKMIAVSMYDNDPYVSEAIANGALAFLSKQFVSVELKAAIEHVLNEEIYYSRDVKENINATLLCKEKAKINDLTERELEIFKLLAKGVGVKSVASQLNIQPKTVHTHRANIINKLDMSNQNEFLQLALSTHVLSIDDLKYG
ncbi:MAG: hypothetical protein COA74_11100 [Gammaproteobacteria bacterium]|nr:MAG: hypothetical protein COA74_11100 [Gammaproteobacteria bacterium]